MTKDEFIDKYKIRPHKDILRGDKIATASLVECGKHKPEVDRYGILPCKKCHEERDKTSKVNAYPEMVPDYIKEDRKKNLKSQIQSHRQGIMSKEFIESYPEKVRGMLKEGVVTPSEVKKARYVWKDLPNYNNLHKTQ